MSFTLTTSQACIAKASSAGSSVAYLSGALMDKWSDQVESTINTITRKDWVAAISSATVKDGFKYILDDTASSMIAIKIINYDKSGFESGEDSVVTLNVLNYNANRNLEVLKDMENKRKMF